MVVPVRMGMWLLGLFWIYAIKENVILKRKAKQ